MSENRDTIDEKERKKEEELSRSLGTVFVPVDLTPHYIPPRWTPPPAPAASSSSSSSSTTLKTSATARDTEASGKVNLKRSEEGKNVVVSPFKKPKDVIMTHDYDDVDVISESKSGDSTKRPSQGLQDRPDTYKRDPPLFHISTKIKEEEEEEEEEKTKQVSKEGNPPSSSSTPLEETATETEGFDEKMTLKPSAEGNVDVPFKKLTIHDDADVLPQSKSG
ncbi:hypothetical protein LOK49_LG15G00873 [Camellia lanceoleosa]|uniref:Uncharacterized protein n=1 Tax=Camellia lanceoleosa TaxID=1840588 RepID=A0ACC0F6H9_9ERIC|nr:hypothetical protein LOK49_LG15G00873 [Camellia lanceoleosa]